MTAEAYDYVVIGGGSSGCVLAGRLSDDPGARVLLLETGDRAEQHPETLRADGYKDAFINDALLHHRFSTTQRGAGGRPLWMGSGRGMGGSGSINAMVYLRGSEADFRAWEVPGWGWSDVVPAFGELERVLDVRPRPPTEFTEACIHGAEEVGFHRERDLDRGELLGALGYEAMNYAGDRRRSAYVAFVQPRAERSNLSVRTGAHAHRLVLDDRRRVVAVEYETDGALHTAAVKREAILCAGALESPKLLMLSGIGPREALRPHGIEPIFDLPGVGENLQDHPNVQLFFVGRRTVDCNYPQLYGFHRALADRPDLADDAADTCYVFYPARSSFREATMRMLPALVVPPSLYQRTRLPRLVRGGVSLAFKPGLVRRLVERLYGIVVILGKPKSRGTVRLASPRARDHALIDPAYLSDPTDLATMLAGVRLARKIAGASALREWGNTEVMPGRWAQSDTVLGQYVRRMVMTTYHYGGTCRMGQTAGSVVDERLRVRGTLGLRVADASIMPVVPVSALNAPSMMIGWRAADLIREDAASAG